MKKENQREQQFLLYTKLHQPKLLMGMNRLKRFQ